MKGMELYRLDSCYCKECEYHGKDGWCRQWKAYTDEDGFCHKAEMKSPEWEDEFGLREEWERNNDRYVE